MLHDGALPEGLFHCLGIVYLAVANAARLLAEAQTATVGILDELLRRDELDAAIHHIAARHLLRISMLAQQFQLGCKGAEGYLHTLALTEPQRDDLLQKAKEMLHLALARVAILGAEFIDVVEVVLALYDGLGVEQRLAVVTLCGARLQFKEYSVSLTWHSGIILVTFCKVTKKN